MELKKGNLFKDSDADILLFTSNGVVKRTGELVMGAGAARAAALADPDLPKLLGSAILRGHRALRPGIYEYGLVIVESRGFGAFQTKYHYREPSPLSLVALSARMLAREATANPGTTYAVNFPGVGLGGLNRNDVLSLIQPLWAELPIEVWSL